MGKFGDFVKIIGLDIANSVEDKQFAEKFFKEHLFKIDESIKDYNAGGFKEKQRRYAYLHPSNIIIDEDDSEDSDDDPMDGSRGGQEIEPKDKVRKINQSNFEAKCKYIQNKVVSLQQVIEQDVMIIKKLAPQYECEFLIYSRNEKGSINDKAFKDNCLTICFILDPRSIFEDPKIAYWHDIDFSRKICILISFIYSMNINPTGSKPIADTMVRSQLVSSLNEAKACEVVGFQTNTSNSFEILNNYANDPKYYPKDSAIYPIAQFIKEAISQKGNRWIDDEVSNVLKKVQNISIEDKFYNIYEIGRTLNNDICALLLVKLCGLYPDKFDVETAVNYFVTMEESKHTAVYHDEVFDDFATIKLYGEYKMFNFTSLRSIYVEECKRDLASAYKRCDELFNNCDPSVRDFYLKSSYLNNTISEKEEINVEFEKILIENSRYYFVIPLFLFIGREISHRCRYCFKNLNEVSETYKCCNDPTCKHQQERLNGYGLEDYIILHNYEFELLLSYYVAASYNEGRGFMNAPTVELPKQMTEEEIKKLIDEGDLNKIKSTFESVVPEQYMNNPEKYQQQVNEAMNKVIRQLPSMDELIELSQKHTLRKVLNSRNPLLYPLLRWIAFNSENMIVHVPDHMKWNGCDATHVFLIRKGIYKYEDIYSRLKNSGRTFRKFFHGSPYGCWHSIVKNGIKNMSNTSYMSTGAAYGDGIYMSDSMGVSSGYSRHVNLGSIWRNRLGDNLSCSAIVEVNEGTYTANGNIFVAQKEEEVFLRYLLVWSNGGSNNMSVNGTPDDVDSLYNSIPLNE